MATMMISKFNQLIRSRVLWGAFLVVIVLAFVVWGMPSCIPQRADGGSLAEGTLDGESVSPEEFQHARVGAYIDFLVQVGPDMLHEADFDQMLREHAWQRLAQLKQAEKWGLRATREEVQSAIASNFADNSGNFSRDMYAMFYQNRLQPQGVTLGQFEQFFAEMILLNKLRYIVGQQVVVTPLEVRQAFETLGDRYDAQYAVVESAPLDASLQVSDEQIRAAYDEDPDSYRLPEHRVASYVRFDPETFIDAEQVFEEEEIEDFYNENLTIFATTVTNEDGTTSAGTLSLEEAHDDILAAMRKNAAVERAENAANGFASKTFPGRDGVIPDFADVAAAEGLVVTVTPSFSIGEAPVPPAGSMFVQEAFSRDLGAFDAVSDPISGDDGMLYVLHLDRIEEPRTPEFEEVEAQATARARAKALDEALHAKAKEAHEAIGAAVAAGTAFEEAAVAQGLIVVTPKAFTGIEANSPSEDADPALPALAAALATCNDGEITEPFVVPAGLAIGFLSSHTPADEATFEQQKASIAGIIRQRRSQEAYSEFLTGLLAPGRFKDLHPIAEDEGLSDEEVDAAAQAEAEAETEE